MRMGGLRLTSVLLLSSGFLLPATATDAGSAATKTMHLAKKTTVNGVSFSVPKGYVQSGPGSLRNAALLYYAKYKEGLMVVVPDPPFDEAQLVKEITATGLSAFFPKERQTFEWKDSNNYRKLSKFEVSEGQAMGFNRKALVLLKSHHLRFADRDILVFDFFKFDQNDAAEVYARGHGVESMQGCNDMVELIYSITGEKIDDTNSPCDLVALPGAVNN